MLSSVVSLSVGITFWRRNKSYLQLSADLGKDRSSRGRTLKTIPLALNAVFQQSTRFFVFPRSSVNSLPTDWYGTCVACSTLAPLAATIDVLEKEGASPKMIAKASSKLRLFTISKACNTNQADEDRRWRRGKNLSRIISMDSHFHHILEKLLIDIAFRIGWCWRCWWRTSFCHHDCARIWKWRTILVGESKTNGSGYYSVQWENLA